MTKKRDYSLSSQRLRHKLRIAFLLMSILPLLVCIYLVSTYILPQAGIRPDVAASILISIIIAFFGFSVLKDVFGRIINVSQSAKMIAAGDISRRVDIRQKDEVGDLGDALNLLTQRIRNNMDELNNYSEKTTEINLEIQKRVIVLSSLLQLSSLISQNAKLEEILKIAIEKARLLANSDVAYLLFREEGQEVFFMKAADGIISGHLFQIKVEPHEGFFSKIIKTNRPFILDGENALPESLNAAFYEKFKLKNTLAIPVYLRKRVAAILGIGNTKTAFSYKKEDVELLDVFAKQVAIAIENDLLIQRIEKLEIKDPLTGLYNEVFIRNRLQEEIKRAITCQRPCAFILLNIDNFRKFHHSFGSLQAEATLKKIALLIKSSVTEIDRVARAGDNEFAIVLPEKNKRQAGQIAEELRKKIEFSFSEEPDVHKRLTLSAGVAENPLDGIEAEELITKAKELLMVAKAEGGNRIAVI